MSDEDGLGERRWPDATRAQVSARAGRPDEATLLVFAPTGRNEPFELTLEREGRRVTLVGDPLNRVRLRP